LQARIGLEEVLQLLIDLLDLILQPTQMPFDAPGGPRRLAQPVAFGNHHLHELAAARPRGAKLLCGLFA
jgi:hypothetical protein